MNLGIFGLIFLFSGFTWSLNNFLQIAYFLPAVSLELPSNLNRLFGLLGLANMNIDLLEDLIINMLSSVGLRERLEIEGPLSEIMPYSQLLLNAGSIILLWILFGFLLLVLLSSKILCPRYWK